MQFDPENNIVKLCGEGMMAEGEGDAGKASILFQQAWDSATNDFEAFIAAHYLARHQNTPDATLKWNIESLKRAKQVDNEEIRQVYPSLYLNIGKSYEDLGRMKEAKINYQLGEDNAWFLPDDGYGKMIK